MKRKRVITSAMWRKTIRDFNAQEAARKALRAKGSSKAAKTARGSALTQR